MMLLETDAILEPEAENPPETVIALGTRVKAPGRSDRTDYLELVARHDRLAPAHVVDAAEEEVVLLRRLLRVDHRDAAELHEFEALAFAAELPARVNFDAQRATALGGEALREVEHALVDAMFRVEAVGEFDDFDIARPAAAGGEGEQRER